MYISVLGDGVGTVLGIGVGTVLGDGVGTVLGDGVGRLYAKKLSKSRAPSPEVDVISAAVR